MRNEIVAFAQTQVRTAVRRAVVPAAFAAAGSLFAVFAVAGLFGALFFWLEPDHGPLVASLAVTAVALVLGVLAFLPLAFKRQPPPQLQEDGALPQFVSLMARTAPSLAPRQLIATAALLALAVVFAPRRQKNRPSVEGR
jgi:hypothetical protein